MATCSAAETCRVPCSPAPALRVERSSLKTNLCIPSSLKNRLSCPARSSSTHCSPESIEVCTGRLMNRSQYQDIDTPTAQAERMSTSSSSSESESIRESARESPMIYSRTQGYLQVPVWGHWSPVTSHHTLLTISILFTVLQYVRYVLDNSHTM